MLCFSGHVAVSPLPPSERRRTQRGQQGVSTGRASGRGTGTGTLRYPGRAGGEGGDMYRERFASTPHTPSFYKAAFWGFVLFIFAKTIVLNKCRPFFLRLCSGPAQGKAEGRGRVGERGGQPPVSISGSSVPSWLLAPARRLGVWGGGMSGVGWGGSKLLLGKTSARRSSRRKLFPRWPRWGCVLGTRHKASWDEDAQKGEVRGQQMDEALR